jgi:2'-5' RNA ligase
MPSTATWPPTGRLDDHWGWRPEWATDRPCLYWYLTFERSRLADALGPELLDAVDRTDWLDPVPPRWMHLTVCDVGFVDELGAEAADAAHAAAGHLVEDRAPVTLTLGPVTTLSQAVVLSAGPQRRLRNLQARARRATERVWRARPYGAGRPYFPHVSLGYVNRAVDRETVATSVDALPPVRTEVEVDRLTLAAVTRRDRHYQWHVAAEVDLASGRVAASHPSAPSDPAAPAGEDGR